MYSPTDESYVHTWVYRFHHSGISLLHHFIGSLFLSSILDPPFPSSHDCPFVNFVFFGLGKDFSLVVS